MNELLIILMILGGAFAGIGSLVGIIFLATMGPGVFLAIPGCCFIGGCIYYKNTQKKIRTKGRKYSGKIYGYVKDTSVRVNGAFPVNIKVRYFDERRVEREAIIPTQFAPGSSRYPIGMTIDIFEYQGKFQWDPASVRAQYLFGEEELMDDQPLEPDKLTMTAVRCDSCGASFSAAAGYAGKCPYCGSYTKT